MTFTVTLTGLIFWACIYLLIGILFAWVGNWSLRRMGDRPWDNDELVFIVVGYPFLIAAIAWDERKKGRKS